MKASDIKLTTFSHGAGCGCKLAPSVLDEILKNSGAQPHFPQLLVGHNTKDDAAVYALPDGTAIVSTTDFFMPIVDDAFDFGRIASANALSDIYAMGAKPLMAIAILGWPVNMIPADVAAKVIEGSRSICAEAGIPLAGGHSIDSPEPIFGLAVTGTAPVRHIKRNDTATPGCSLFLTKPLGVGILTTAKKLDRISDEHFKAAVDNMLLLNNFGALLGELDYVKAMTDVTGFGLVGHLLEVCEGSGVSAEIEFSKIPYFDFVEKYIRFMCVPGATARIKATYKYKISGSDDFMDNILFDPQTSGGLLICVDEKHEKEFIALAAQHDLQLKPFGKTVVSNGNIQVIVLP